MVTFLLLAPITSFAQKRSDPGGNTGISSTRDAILIRDADLQNRELRLRLLNEGGRSGPSPTAERTAADRKLIVRQIFEDFERIQVIDRGLMEVSSNLNTTTYKRVSSLAEEMNKRAKRLKENLEVPNLDHEKKASDKALAIDDTQLRASLQMLSSSVKTFVTNPLFQDPRVTDVRQLDSLRRAISDIIDLSHSVKQTATRLTSH